MIFGDMFSGHLCFTGPDKGAAQDTQLGRKATCAERFAFQRPSDGLAILPCFAWDGRKTFSL